MQNYARTIVAALWDFKVLHSRLLAEPDDLENGVDHGLERGPAIEWGHDASLPWTPNLVFPMHSPCHLAMALPGVAFQHLH